MSYQEGTASAASIQHIYNSLLAGNKISMSFQTMQEATSFRSLLGVVKHRQNKLALQLELYAPDAIPVLEFKFLTREPPIKVVLAFVQKKEGKQFVFEVLDDGMLEEPHVTETELRSEECQQ